jgi:hypothetical protein
MDDKVDRLYKLLPTVYQQQEADARRYALRDLLRVIAEQVDIVEADIDQLYENWFIETCQDWAVPYIGALVGYRPVLETGLPDETTATRTRQRYRTLVPRREVADTIRNRRRKGTLALLEELAADVAGWPARAVEFYTRLDWLQAMQHVRPEVGRTVDVRHGDALDRLDGPFDELAHTVDVRRINSQHTKGRYNIPSVGLFVWRLKVYPISNAPAYCLEERGEHCYTFSVLGNDSPLYTLPEPEAKPTSLAGELNLPVPIRRRALAARLKDYYGPGKSFQIWTGDPPQLVPADRVMVADLTDWQYQPPRDKVAVDPERGRMTFNEDDPPHDGVWVSYHYGFSADIGGGEYKRSLSHLSDAALYRVGAQEEIQDINEALAKWRADVPDRAVIEITDSGDYLISGDEAGTYSRSRGRFHIKLRANQILYLRAANHTRPVIRLLDWRTNQPDALRITGEPGSRFTLDGLLVSGRGLNIEGDLDEVGIRHVTLVPGWTLGSERQSQPPAEPSLVLSNTPARVTIAHSIIGSIQVNQDEVKAEPIPIQISDSVLDATDNGQEALGAPSWPLAHAVLTVLRSTVIGQVQTHAIDLAENSIFMGRITVGRRQLGCMRFCYVAPDSRTPRRYRCQPDLVEQAVEQRVQRGEILAADEESAQARERLRVRPQFNSLQYGSPAYCQLAEGCAEEITSGADDESEMGVFHDLYQYQRAANLRARLEEYTPAGMQAGILYAT